MKYSILFCLFLVGCKSVATVPHPKLMLSEGSQSPTITLEWDASTSPGIAGYNVYYGGEPGAYTNSFVVPSLTANAPAMILLPLYYAVTAIGTNGLESDFSNEINGALLLGRSIQWSNPPSPCVVQQITNLIDWQTVNPPFTFDQPKAFYRLKSN